MQPSKSLCSPTIAHLTSASYNIPRPRVQVSVPSSSAKYVPFPRVQVPITSNVKNATVYSQHPPATTHLPQPTKIWTLNHIYDTQGKKLNIDKLITMADTNHVWLWGLDNELGWLAQGFEPNKITGTNTLKFIEKMKIPSNRKITYANFFVIYDHLRKKSTESKWQWVRIN